MAPMPENVNLPNPLQGETDRETRVRFNRNWSHAYGGVDVVRYAKDQIADVSAVCAEALTDPANAIKGADGKAIFAGEIVDPERVACFDPRAPKPVPVSKKR